MITVSTQVEFYQGTKGQLCRVIRTPEKVLAHLLFIAPLFEQANKTRHHITRSAINAYQQGLQSIIFDHYGTGDSTGELTDANLALWQQDILHQLSAIKAQSSQAIHLSLPLSAVLLLSDEMLSLVDSVILLQPDFNGSRFVEQFKRLALATQISNNSHNQSQGDKTDHAENSEQPTIEIAGYLMQASLLDELAGKNLNSLADFHSDCYWFEWQAKLETLNPDRAEQQKAVVNKRKKLLVQQIDDVKFWQTTELQIAQSFLTQEQRIFAQLTFSTPVSPKRESNR